MINLFLANLIYSVHLISGLFIFTGFILLPIPYLKYYIFLIIAIFLGWSIFGSCILTSIEHGLRTGEWNLKSAEEELAPEFFRPTMKKYFNLDLTRDQANRLNQGLFMGFLLIAFVRLLKKSVIIV